MTQKNFELVLYHFESCPYCQMVRQFLRENNINIPEKDILEDPSARAELLEIGGKSQVPCLIINGEPLYESMDIVEWVKSNLLGQ